MKKRVFSLLITVTMLLSLFTTVAFATGGAATATGTITPVYTRENGFWGEGGGNASESLVVELYEGDIKIASASLNNVGGIIDGDVYVTWSIPFAGSTDEYWTIEWAEGYPKYDMAPTKGVMVIDGISVAESAVQFNAPDNLNKIVALAEGNTGGVVAYTTLTDAMGNFNGRKVNVLRDVTESIEEMNGCTLTTNIEGGVTITSTYDNWIYCNDLSIGEGVTVKGGNVFYETDGENTVEGTLNVDETFYHGYDAKTTVQNGGSIKVGGSTILRYNESADSGLYIYGDSDDSTVEFDCNYYIGAYSGTFYAEDATIETGYFLLKNSYDNSDYADIDMTLDNSTLTVVGTTDTQDSFIIDDQASLTLKNDSAIADVRDFNILAGANLALNIDATSSVYATNVSIAEDIPLIAAKNSDGSVDFELKISGISGTGTESDPFLINNLAELLWLQEKVDEQAADGSTQFAGKYFKLTADIDLAGINWNPIGSMSGDHGSFKGVFDGDGHTISNLNCQQAGNGLGLFARTSGNAEIKNLTLKNVTVKSTDNSNYVGAVVGNSYASTKISNVHVTGNIDVSGRGYIGGISGHGYVVMDNVSVKGEGTISSTFWCAGGILGYGGEGTTHISNAVVEGTGNGLIIKSAAGGLGSIVGMAEDNEGTQPISGENLSAKNIVIQTYEGGYSVESYGEYALGYLYGGNETSELTGTNKIDNVTFDLSTGNPNPAVGDMVAQLEDMTVYKTLAEAIEKAKDGETIKLLSNIELTGPIAVKKSIVIDGDNKTITQSEDCNNNIALLYFEGANGADLNVTVKNVTFDGIKEGAAIRTLYTDMTIDNVVFQNCEHTTVGQGLVRLTYGTAKITNSKFLNNTCPMGISFNWDGAGNADDTLTVDNCVFEGNTANKTALIYYVKGAGCTITKSEFVNNKVNCADNGAVIYLGFQDNCTVSGNLFKDNVVTEANTSTRVAGAIFAGYQATITDNAFDGNTASNANGDTLGQVCVSVYYEEGNIDLSSNFWGGEAPAYGKDYTVQHQTGTGTYSFVDYYTAYTLDDNGNVVLNGKVAGTNAVAEIDGEYYTSLEEAVAAVENGGTIKLLQDAELSSQLNVQKDISFTLDGNGNTISGALRFNGTDCNLKNVVFENCISGTYAAVEFVNSESTLTDCVFQNNNVDVIAIDCDVPKGTGTSEITIVDCVFEKNTSHAAGIINYADGKSCEITDCDFIDNTGTYAVVYISDDASVSGCYFNGNTLSGSNANKAVVLAGPYDELSQTTYYEVVINGNAFLDTEFPGVWMEDWKETYGAINTYDISNNYWLDGNKPVKDTDYGVTRDPAVTNNSYADKYTRNDGKPGVIVSTYSAPIYVPTTPTYKVTVSDTTDGTVKTNSSYATNGQTVTITVDPDKGYVLETLTVLDKNGKAIELTTKGNGKYTFKMPASKVTVYATFMEDNTMLNYFVDVFASDYYYDAVLWAVENGITNGTSATTFSPDAVCTRAQVVTFLWRAAGSPEPVSTVMPFSDVAADAYYYDAVLWAVENGITNGTSATTFSPDADCTRGQIVTFLWRSQGSENASGYNPFVDVADGAYYEDAVLWAVEEAITNGTGANTFSPDADCTRGQIVTFLYRCLAE